MHLCDSPSGPTCTEPISKQIFVSSIVFFHLLHTDPKTLPAREVPIYLEIVVGISSMLSVFGFKQNSLCANSSLSESVNKI